MEKKVTFLLSEALCIQFKKKKKSEHEEQNRNSDPMILA